MKRYLLVGIVVVSLAAACGDDAASTPATSSTLPTTTSVAPTTDAPTTTTTTAVPTTTTTTTTTTTIPATTTTVPAATTAPTTVPADDTIVAVWPAADVVFDTPEAAAEDFIEQVFGVEPFIGEFMQGDARSGEIEVLTPLDDDDPATTAPTGVILFLRQLGPDDGWFVLSAVSEGVTIDEPAFGDEVARGAVTVTGTGRGFESTVVVRAVVPGVPPTVLDVEIVMTDWMDPVPYTATLDLTAASPGDVVTLVAVGDTGIEATGEFATLPVVISVG